jgi:hypothetical protein
MVRYEEFQWIDWNDDNGFSVEGAFLLIVIGLVLSVLLFLLELLTKWLVEKNVRYRAVKKIEEFLCYA